MYIREFWCGVAACIATEMVLVIIAGIISDAKKQKKEGKSNGLQKSIFDNDNKN